MTIINTYADNQLTDLIFNHFGSNLASLNLDEQLYLLETVVCYIGDAEEEMQDDAIEAAKQLKLTTETPVEAMALILGLGDLLDIKAPLTNYLTNWWTEAAIEAFGASLEKLTTNEKAWNLYSLLQEIIEHGKITWAEEIDSIDIAIDSANLTQQELIKVARAISHIAVEFFYGNTSAA